MKFRLPLLWVFSFMLFSCSKKNEAAPASIDLGTDYYPIDVGKYVIYDVDSVVYTDLSKDTLIYNYRIKEKITESFTDNLGLPALRLERSIKKFDPSRSYDSIPWTIKEVWAVNADTKNIQVVESNQRFTKLIFPVQANSFWNGNAFNALSEQSYVYKYINNTERIGSVNLNNVLMVQQIADTNLIYYKYSVEKYAKGIGLVYREITDIESNTIVSGIPVKNRIEQGIIYKQTLHAHGIE